MEEVNTEKDPIEVKYDALKDLKREKGLDGFAALLAYKKGDKSAIEKIYKQLPELNSLSADELEQLKNLGKTPEQGLSETRAELIKKYTKEVIGLIYNNLSSLKNGTSLHDGDLPLLLQNGAELAQLFQELKKQKPGQGNDLFPRKQDTRLNEADVQLRHIVVGSGPGDMWAGPEGAAG